MKKYKMDEIEYGKWGKCLRLSNDEIEVIVTLEFGPRIIKYSFIGEENIFFEDIENTLSFNTEAFKKYNTDEKWTIYGGHRLWVSPQSDPQTYYPDNNKVTYEEKNGIVLFESEVEKWNNIKKVIEISLDEKGTEVKLKHKIYNLGAWPIELAPWSVSVVRGGGLEVIPVPKNVTDPLENILIKFWSCSKLNDPRFKMEEDYLLLRQDNKIDDDFKVGINNLYGWAGYYESGTVFIKYNEYDFDKLTANYETYANKNYLEMESVGKYTKIMPEKFAELDEKWRLFKTDKIDILNVNEIKEKIKELV